MDTLGKLLGTEEALESHQAMAEYYSSFSREIWISNIRLTQANHYNIDIISSKSSFSKPLKKDYSDHN